MTTSEVPATMRQRAADLTTAGLSDALDRLGIVGQVAGVRPLGPSCSVCGPAFTVRYRAVEALGETVGDYIDDVPPGSVVVIDNQGRTDCTVWGDILTEAAHGRGVVGTVIDGVCRDARWSERVGYPVYALANWMRTGKDRVTVEAVRVCVQVGGVTVESGDLVVGDRDGIVVLPASSLAEIVDLAESIETTEGRIREAVRSGERLDAARERLGYHLLQRHTGSGGIGLTSWEQQWQRRT
jgi:4-hydroxy-4-methyl-2-oxoglutarate aldolase